MSCMRVVPEAISTACEENSTVAGKGLFGYSGDEIAAFEADP